MRSDDVELAWNDVRSSWDEASPAWGPGLVAPRTDLVGQIAGLVRSRRPGRTSGIRFDQMSVSVTMQVVQPRKLAAVRREVALGGVGAAWGPAVGKVWDFLRGQPGLRSDGHNVFLYHHPPQPGAPIQCDFGVEVTRHFERAGEVYGTETPAGEAAVAVHRGPYNRMNEAHDAIRRWMAANGRESAGHSWEIYGDPTPDPSGTETTVVYLLK